MNFIYDCFSQLRQRDRHVVERNRKFPLNLKSRMKNRSLLQLRTQNQLKLSPKQKFVSFLLRTNLIPFSQNDDLNDADTKSSEQPDTTATTTTTTADVIQTKIIFSNTGFLSLSLVQIVPATNQTPDEKFCLITYTLVFLPLCFLLCDIFSAGFYIVPANIHQSMYVYIYMDIILILCRRQQIEQA